jgi:hypothetical protein
MSGAALARTSTHDPKSHGRYTLIVYGLAIGVAALGLVVSPLVIGPHPPRPEKSGSTLLQESIGQFTVPVLVEITVGSSHSSNMTLTTGTPVLTTIEVSFGETMKNETNQFRITSAVLRVSNAVLANRTALGSPAGVPLEVSTDNNDDWNALGNAMLEFTQAGDWKGTLVSTAELNNGTTLDLNFPITEPGLVISAPITPLTTVSGWIDSFALWASALTILVFGRYFVRVKTDRTEPQSATKG